LVQDPQPPLLTMGGPDGGVRARSPCRAHARLACLYGRGRSIGTAEVTGLIQKKQVAEQQDSAASEADLEESGALVPDPEDLATDADENLPPRSGQLLVGTDVQYGSAAVFHAAFCHSKGWRFSQSRFRLPTCPGHASFSPYSETKCLPEAGLALKCALVSSTGELMLEKLLLPENFFPYGDIHSVDYENVEFIIGLTMFRTVRPPRE